MWRWLTISVCLLATKDPAAEVPTNAPPITRGDSRAIFGYDSTPDFIAFAPRYRPKHARYSDGRNEGLRISLRLARGRQAFQPSQLRCRAALPHRLVEDGPTATCPGAGRDARNDGVLFAPNHEPRWIIKNDGRRHCWFFLPLPRFAAERTRLLPPLATLLDA